MKTYTGNVGTKVKLDVGQDLSAATAVEIEALKPDAETVVVWAASVVETTKVQHIIAAGELDDGDGDWILQAKVWFGSNYWYGESARLTVFDRFK